MNLLKQVVFQLVALIYCND